MSAHRIIESINVFANGFDCVISGPEYPAMLLVTLMRWSFSIRPGGI